MLRQIKRLKHFLFAILANIYYGFPGKGLTVIGVTGTDGKTTTSNIIYHILRSAGLKVSKITTIDSEIDGKVISTSMHTTTPSSFQMQKFLYDSRNSGCKFAVIEVSSHGVDQNRIWGIPFAVGVLTNIANNEHLDYHGSFDDYRNTKLNFLASCQEQVVNANGLTRKQFSFETPLVGKFNEENCLSAIAVCRVLKIPNATIRDSLKTLVAPSGRLNVVISKPFLVIIDFAHTPQAFERVLPEVKRMGTSKSRLIHVFGTTGDRDKSKRPLMAKIAAQYDDFVFLTHEDTYHEDKFKIISDVEKGFIQAGFSSFEKVLDRKGAIEKALKYARPGDVVILTGLGHQKTMNIGGKEVEFDEEKIIRDFVKNEK